MSNVQVGSLVRAHYNSGIYIGEIIQDRGDRYLVEVHAVQKHPMQGDLHHPGKAEGEGVLFLERKALAPREKMNVTKAVVYPFDGDVPPYNESLKQAVEEARERLRAKNTEFSRKALDKIAGLETHFYKKYY